MLMFNPEKTFWSVKKYGLIEKCLLKIVIDMFFDNVLEPNHGALDSLKVRLSCSYCKY